MIKKELEIDVLTAARKRIKNVFSNGKEIRMAFSGGKDSICLVGIVEEMIQAGEIDPSLLTVQFIDEEAIFPCVEKIVKSWRLRFLSMGVKFEWYALEVKHFSCLNSLSQDESFICWDRTKKDVWIRQPPSFAITNAYDFNARKETYQTFLDRHNSDAIAITGVRAFESIQRMKNIANKKSKNRIEPIYDFRDKDIWLYILRRNLEIPDIYLYLYQTGKEANKLRVSQFFSIDTIGSLVKMNEYYPDLMERIQRREENAYLVALYWDTEMFGRSSRTRKENEKKLSVDEYRNKIFDIFKNPEKFFDSKQSLHLVNDCKKLFMKWEHVFTIKEYKKLYEMMIVGDPKKRTYRALIMNLGQNQNKVK